MRYRLLGICSTLILSIAPASGYFEWKYFCTIESGNITVSLNSGSQKCFTYLAGVETVLMQLEADLSQAQDFVTR